MASILGDITSDAPFNSYIFTQRYRTKMPVNYSHTHRQVPHLDRSVELGIAPGHIQNPPSLTGHSTLQDWPADVSARRAWDSVPPKLSRTLVSYGHTTFRTQSLYMSWLSIILNVSCSLYCFFVEDLSWYE